MGFAKAHARLAAAAPKELAKDHYQDGELRCAMGHICPSTIEVARTVALAAIDDDGEWSDPSIQDLARDFPAVAQELRELGLSEWDAAQIQYENDTFEGAPAERAEYMDAWLRLRASDEVAS